VANPRIEDKEQNRIDQYRRNCGWSSVDKSHENWLSWQRALRDRRTNFRSMINYSCISTNPEMLAEIGPVDVEIIGLTEIVKKETEAEHTPAFDCRFSAG